MWHGSGTYGEGQFQELAINPSHVRVIRGHETPSKITCNEILTFCIQLVGCGCI